MCELSAYVAFNKAKTRTKRYKTRKGVNAGCMSLLKIAVEKLPPSQKIEF